MRKNMAAHSSWESYYQKADAAFEAADYAQALSWAERAYQAARLQSGEDARPYGEVLLLLASCHVELEQYEAALRIHEQIQTLGADFWTENPEGAVAFLNEKAVAYLELDQPEAAHPPLVQALKMVIASLDEDSEEAISTQFNLAHYWQAMGHAENTRIAFDGLAQTLSSLSDARAAEYGDIWETLADYYRETQVPIKRIDAEAGWLHALAAEAGVDSKAYLRQLQQLCIDCTEHRLYGRAATYVEENLLLREQIAGKESQGYATAMRLKGRLLDQLGEYQDALPLLQEAIMRYEAAPNPQSRTLALMYIDRASVQIGLLEFPDAEADLLHAQNLLTQHGQVADALSLFDQFSMCYQFMGKYEQAANNVREAMDLLSHQNQAGSREYVFLQIKLASILSRQGQYESADAAFVQGMDAIEQLFHQKHLDYAWAIGEYSNHLRMLNQHDRVLDFTVRRFHIYTEQLGEDHPETLDARLELIRISLHMGHVKDLEAVLLQTQALLESIQAPTTAHATFLLLAGQYYRQCHRYQEAGRYLTQARELLERQFGREHVSYLPSLSNLGGLHMEQDQYQEADSYFRPALALAARCYDKQHLIYANALNNLANCSVAREAYTEALELFQELCECYLQQIQTLFPVQSERERTLLFSQCRFAFADFNQLAVQVFAQRPHITRQMYDYWLAVKGLVFYSTARFKQLIAESEDTSLRSTYDDWLSKKKYWATRYDHTRSDDEHHRYLLQLEQKINRIEKELSLAAKSLSPFQVGAGLSWEAVRQQLQPKEAAIEIIRLAAVQQLPARYIALVLHAALDAPALIEIGPVDEIEQLGLPMYQQIDRLSRSNRGSFAWEQVEKEGAGTASALYHHCWQPIAQYLKAAGLNGRVYLSLDGFYHEFNLNSLRNPETQAYVLDEWDLHLLASTRDLCTRTASTASAPAPSAVLLGYPTYYFGPQPETAPAADPAHISPLPGTRAEVEAIGQLLTDHGWKTHIFTERQASEHALKQVEGPTVLHVATHGFFLQAGTTARSEVRSEVPVHPLFHTGLLLAGAGTSKQPRQEGVFIGLAGHEDGWFSAYEAALLDLKDTQLVVLSACETGRGIYGNSEGLFGFQRAFFEAGASCLLTSLWRVNDEATQEMMHLFYEFWLGGQTRRAAFRAAQQALRKKYTSPYYWAAFVMLGE